jgi:hypothetical protein
MFNWFKKDKKKNEDYSKTLESQNTESGIEVEDDEESLGHVDEAFDRDPSVAGDDTNNGNDTDSGTGGFLERLKNGLYWSLLMWGSIQP